MLHRMAMVPWGKETKEREKEMWGLELTLTRIEWRKWNHKTKVEITTDQNVEYMGIGNTHVQVNWILLK